MTRLLPLSHKLSCIPIIPAPFLIKLPPLLVFFILLLPSLTITIVLLSAFLFLRLYPYPASELSKGSVNHSAYFFCNFYEYATWSAYPLPYRLAVVVLLLLLILLPPLPLLLPLLYILSAHYFNRCAICIIA